MDNSFIEILYDPDYTLYRGQSKLEYLKLQTLYSAFSFEDQVRSNINYIMVNSDIDYPLLDITVRNDLFQESIMRLLCKRDDKLLTYKEVSCIFDRVMESFPRFWKALENDRTINYINIDNVEKFTYNVERFSPRETKFVINFKDGTTLEIQDADHVNMPENALTQLSEYFKNEQGN